jgi:hypothetical protein
MLGLNELYVALAPNSLRPPAGYAILVVYGYPICDLAFIMSQSKERAFVRLEAKRVGQ